jgi:hypothetical protein
MAVPCQQVPCTWSRHDTVLGLPCKYLASLYPWRGSALGVMLAMGTHASLVFGVVVHQMMPRPTGGLCRKHVINMGARAFLLPLVEQGLKSKVLREQLVLLVQGLVLGGRVKQPGLLGHKVHIRWILDGWALKGRVVWHGHISSHRPRKGVGWMKQAVQCYGSDLMTTMALSFCQMSNWACSEFLNQESPSLQAITLLLRWMQKRIVGHKLQLPSGFQALVQQ